jgi:hypothetical protein
MPHPEQQTLHVSNIGHAAYQIGTASVAHATGTDMRSSSQVTQGHNTIAEFERWRQAGKALQAWASRRHPCTCWSSPWERVRPAAGAKVANTQRATSKVACNVIAECNLHGIASTLRRVPTRSNFVQHTPGQHKHTATATSGTRWRTIQTTKTAQAGVVRCMSSIPVSVMSRCKTPCARND